MKHYLIVVYGDIEPITKGPYATPKTLLRAALKARKDDPNKENGIFWLDIAKNGKPKIGAWSGGCFEDEEVEA